MFLLFPVGANGSGKTNFFHGINSFSIYVSLFEENCMVLVNPYFFYVRSSWWRVKGFSLGKPFAVLIVLWGSSPLQTTILTSSVLIWITFWYFCLWYCSAIRFVLSDLFHNLRAEDRQALLHVRTLTQPIFIFIFEYSYNFEFLVFFLPLICLHWLLLLSFLYFTRRLFVRGLFPSEACLK